MFVTQLGHKFILCLVIALGSLFCASAQRIVIDNSTSSKYLIPQSQIERQKKIQAQKEANEPSFSDKAMLFGKGILTRLKSRFNLEGAAETIKEKGRKVTGMKKEETKPQEEVQEKKEEGS